MVAQTGAEGCRGQPGQQRATSPPNTLQKHGQNPSRHATGPQSTTQSEFPTTEEGAEKHQKSPELRRRHASTSHTSYPGQRDPSANGRCQPLGHFRAVYALEGEGLTHLLNSRPLTSGERSCNSDSLVSALNSYAEKFDFTTIRYLSESC